jgi:hypothetical protein
VYKEEPATVYRICARMAELGLREHSTMRLF